MSCASPPDALDFRAVFEQSPAALLLLKTDAPRWTIVDISDELLRLTHKKREDVVGQPLFEVYPDDHNDAGTSVLQASLELVRHGGKTDVLPVQRYSIKVDGTFQERYWSCCNKPVRGLNGAVRYILHRTEDVTELMMTAERQRVHELERNAEMLRSNFVKQSNELKRVNDSLRATNDRLQAALAAAESANKTKADFLANVSHEIRTPLNVVIGFAQLLERDATLSQTHREQVTVIHKSADHLLGLVNDILDQARMEAGKLVLHPTPVNLAELLKELALEMSLRCRSKGLALRVELDPALPTTVLADELRVRQMVLNLLDNAVKFTAKGSVCLKGRCLPSADPASARLAITVSDTGRGIAPQDMHMLFTRFGQIGRHAGTTGTGLGLPITQQLARKMGGDAYVTSTVGVGSDFAVEIVVPVADNAPPARSSRAPTMAERARLEEAARAVLVVDANEDSRRSVCATLRLIGLQSVAAAANGAEALAAAERELPAIVFMDLATPDWADIARKLRALPDGDRLPIVGVAEATSAPPDAADAPLLAEMLTKPPLRSQVGLALATHGGFRLSGSAEQTAERHVSRRVLVVDDHPLNQRVVGTALERAGHQVVLCGSGAEAVQQVQGDAFDVVLMDLRMPGMDGLEATRRLRSASEGRRQPVVVLMSASVADDDLMKCLDEVGVDGVLPKPFRISDLLSVVSGAELLQRPPDASA